MRVIDLSHVISEEMPVYPGTEPPTASWACTLEQDGFLEKKLTLYSHTGTHIDAPAHIFPNGRTLDSYPAETFLGLATVIDCRSFGPTIAKTNLQRCLSPHNQSDYIILYTGWSSFWGEAHYFNNYPVLSAEAALWLSDFPLKGIGVDTVSVDQMGTDTFAIHKIFLGKNILVIENLTNLEILAGETTDFFCFPLKIARSDGSPVRAMALLQE